MKTPADEIAEARVILDGDITMAIAKFQDAAGMQVSGVELFSYWTLADGVERILAGCTITLPPRRVR